MLPISPDYHPVPGVADPIAPGVERLTANNPGAMTYLGTNSYIVGGPSCCVIDPGPDDEAHLDALLRVLRGRRVSHIVITHSHRDHCGLASRLQQAVGGIIVAEGPHRLARPLHAGETIAHADGSDTGFAPDQTLADGAWLEGEGWALEAVFTPGHAANHLAFALKGTGLLFSGDHVMGWAPTVIAPPDGAMRDYMASLDRLLARRDRAYLPGHGGPVTRPQAYVQTMKTHRLAREKAVLDRVRAGDGRVFAIVDALYTDIPTALRTPAAYSVFAHLEDLAQRGLVRCDGPARFDGLYRAA